MNPLSVGRQAELASRGRVISFMVLRNTLMKLNPFTLLRNPVLFITEIAAVIGTVVQLYSLFTAGSGEAFDFAMVVAIWATLLICNFAEALAETRERERADRFRRTQSDSVAHRLFGKRIEIVAPSRLRAGDIVVVEGGGLIPVDGEIVDGLATVDESAITGESAPVIRESGADTSTVTAGTRVLSGTLRIRTARAPEETFLEKMLGELEKTSGARTGDEIRLYTILRVAGLLAALFIASLIMACFLAGADVEQDVPPLAAFAGLLICLMPVGIAAQLRSCGLAGVGRLLDKGVVANSREAVETARQFTTVLVDKTGTVTVGNREAIEFLPAPSVTIQELAEAAYLASIWDHTPEGESTVVLASRTAPDLRAMSEAAGARPIEFSEFTRMSGIDAADHVLRKGAVESVIALVTQKGGTVPAEVRERASEIAKQGGTPLAVADGDKLLGLIHLRDILKPGIAPQMQALRDMRIRSVLMTGDNPLTASAIAHEAGMDDVFAQATPADKLTYIRREQERGEVVAMVGDGTDDAPSLAQADVALVMNNGSAAAKAAGCMVDLINNPGQIVQVAAVGRQIWAARTALLVYSLFAGIANCLVLAPVLLRDSFPELGQYSLTSLENGQRAVLSGVIVQALATLVLIWPALRGVPYWPRSLKYVVWRNAIVFACAGLVLTPAADWCVYRILAAAHIAGT